MEIKAEGVAVNGAHAPLLRPTSLSASSGELVLAAGDPGAGHTALALALTGRMKPSQGRVLLDGRADPRALRRTIAVVDAPKVTEAEDAISVRDTIAEGLALAGRRSGHRAVRAFLSEHKVHRYADDRWESLAAEVRTRLAVELATARRGIEGIVLDTPDRHGGPPIGWYSVARDRASAGLLVVVLCGPQAARQLGIRPIPIGVDEQPPPAVRTWSPPQPDHTVSPNGSKSPEVHS